MSVHKTNVYSSCSIVNHCMYHILSLKQEKEDCILSMQNLCLYTCVSLVSSDQVNLMVVVMMVFDSDTIMNM